MNKLSFKRVTSTSGMNAYINYKCEGKNVFYDLYKCDNYDLTAFEPHKNCNLFRVGHDSSFMFPLISIDIDRNLVYFLMSYKESIDYTWDKKGLKILFDKPLRDLITA